MINDWQNGGFGIYLHWPFCEAKCPYCDFNSFVTATVDTKRWQTAYLSELNRYAKKTSGRVLNSVFFGGGTPSLMPPDLVQSILSCIKSNWTVANNLEVTLEANPSSVEAGRFAGFKDAGVNRISLGVQALDNDSLRKLGRIHSADDAVQAIEIARKTFDRFSFDLIYARQDQTLQSWKKELRSALEIAGEHLSLYQLTIEPGTAFGKRHAKGMLAGLPNDDSAVDMYLLTQEECAQAGLNNYEVSNYARKDAESLHNLIYWHYGDYIGIGPGAHGRITDHQGKHATKQWLSPNKWLSEAEKGNADSEKLLLTPSDQADEYVIMGLRLSEGISKSRYASLNNNPLSQDALDHLASLNMIDVKGDIVRATTNGRMLLNTVIKEMLTE